MEGRVERGGEGEGGEGYLAGPLEEPREETAPVDGGREDWQLKNCCHKQAIVTPLPPPLSTNGIRLLREMLRAVDRPAIGRAIGHLWTTDRVTRVDGQRVRWTERLEGTANGDSRSACWRQLLPQCW